MKKSFSVIIIISILTLGGFLLINKYYFPPKIVLQNTDLANNLVIKTTHGDINVELIKTPNLAVANIVNLSRKGFYDGVLIHHIVPNLLIQTGDPFTKFSELKDFWGQGGLNSTFPIGSEKNKMNRGTVAMANTGTHSYGSQFLIMIKDTPWMNGQAAVIGHVISGMEVVDKIASTPLDGAGFPLEPVNIISITAL